MASHSEGPWAQQATMSSDSRSIRYINDANGRVIAEVRYAEGAEQRENLANAALIQKAPSMSEALQEIEALLAGHPEAKRGNSKVHYCLCKAKNALRGER